MSVLIWLVCGLLGAWIGQEKDKMAFGLIMGLLLGPVGLIIVGVIPEDSDTLTWCLVTAGIIIFVVGAGFTVYYLVQKKKEEVAQQVKMQRAQAAAATPIPLPATPMPTPRPTPIPGADILKKYGKPK